MWQGVQLAKNYPELNNRPALTILSHEQIEQIHLATMQVLERTGIQISHPRVLGLLKAGGAKVEGNRVRIPAAMVETAIQQSPAHFTLGKRGGEKAIDLQENKSWYGAGLDCVDYLDPITDDRCKFTSEHCRVTAMIANALTNYDWCMILGFADDVQAAWAERVAARQALTYCNKPLFFCCSDIDSLQAIYEMGHLIAGSEKNFRTAPPIASISSAISPLEFDNNTVEKIIFCAEKGIPQALFSGLQAGATSPVTFAGTIVQGSAESLGGLVVAQLVCSEAPAIYGAFNTIMDMATTVFSYGAVEMNLMTAAMAQMAQYYKLPFFGTAGCSDAKSDDDPQAIIEATFSCLSSGLSGANLVHDIGLLDHSALISPKYLVLVDEILSMVSQYMRGIVVNDETLALDLIDRVGPAGNYLEAAHTRRNFRTVWYSKLFDRTTYDVWRQQGGKGMSDLLREKTRRLIACDPEMLPSELIGEMDRMAKHWK